MSMKDTLNSGLRHVAPRPARLHALPAFQDNYVWVLEDGLGRAMVVDPGDAAPVEAFLAAHGLTLSAILLTHHHADHVGGVPSLVAAHHPRVIGPRDARLPACHTVLDDGEGVALDAPACALRCIMVPGHTSAHAAFTCEAPGLPPLLFCGDTLFAGGCGRLFEGTPAQMHASLARLAALPGDTLVCCAHEYTLSNLRFAHAVLPDDAVLADRLAEAETLRARDLPTLPSSITIERAGNVFLRADEPAVQDAVTRHRGSPPRDAVETFAALRAWKDVFR